MSDFKTKLEKVFDYLNDLESQYWEEINEKDEEIDDLNARIKELEEQLQKEL